MCEYKKKISSYFYFSQTFKPKTQRDRNMTTGDTFPRAHDGTWVKKNWTGRIRATGFTCAAEDTGATPSRSVSHNNTKPSSMPATSTARTNTGVHARTLWQGEERVFSGMGPLHTRNHLTWQSKMSWITQRSREQCRCSQSWPESQRARRWTNKHSKVRGKKGNLS